MQPQGWYPDPEGTHAERWFSDGHPTDLVHDQGSQSYHEPPRARPPEWRWWTVVLPGLLALALAGAFLLVAALDSALNCFDGCGRITQGMPVGAAGEIIVAIAAAALLVAGLTTPFWRRAFAAGLWTAVALACVCAALIATARSAASVGPAAGPSAPAAVTPALNVGACTAIGGRVVYSNLTCFGVPYLGDNGQRDYGEVWYSRDGQLTGPAHTVGTGATQAECESGKYLHGPGSVPAKPGHWNAQLSFCMP